MCESVWGVREHKVCECAGVREHKVCECAGVREHKACVRVCGV